MEQITTRKATLGDLEHLLRFEQGIIEAERPFDSTLKDGTIHYYDIAAMIISPDAEVVVAESAAGIIGSGFARIEKAKPYLKHTNHAWLGFMYVAPNHRGKGVNRKIMEALKQWAVLQHVTEFRLTVYQNNESAIRAYEKVGFTEHLIEMRMNVRDA